MRRWLTGKTLSWASYDFGNTMFSMNVVTLYFPLYLIQSKGVGEGYLSIAISVSMALAALSSPVLGSISDTHLKKNLLLAATTTFCCIACALIPAFSPLYACLLFFIAANFLYQLSLVLYDSLLPSATEAIHFGPVSGFGVALGYAGTLLALWMGTLLVKTPADNGKIFLPTALLFLVFALPCFFVKEIKHAAVEKVYIRNTLRKILNDKNLLHYFIGHILYLDAVNTVIAFMAVFLVKAGNFSQEGGEVNKFFMFSTLFATLGGLLWGWVVKRLDAKRGLVLTLQLWCLLLFLILLPLQKWHFWLLGPMTGIALGGVWSCDRPLLLHLIPKEESGSFFGFYYLTGKISSVIGPLLFGVILSLPFADEITRYKIAFGSLLMMTTGALFFIKKVNHAKRET